MCNKYAWSWVNLFAENIKGQYDVIYSEVIM